jgi:hypothetical protein
VRGELIEYIVLVVAQLDVARPGPCLSVYPSSCACPSVEASGVPFDDNFSSSQKKNTWQWETHPQIQVEIHVPALDSYWIVI